MRKEERNPVLDLERMLQTIKTVNPISACAKNGVGFPMYIKKINYTYFNTLCKLLQLPHLLRLLNQGIPIVSTSQGVQDALSIGGSFSTAS